jgi:hypothetical protein
MFVWLVPDVGIGPMARHIPHRGGDVSLAVRSSAPGIFAVAGTPPRL